MDPFGFSMRLLAINFELFMLQESVIHDCFIQVGHELGFYVDGMLS